MCLCTWTYPSHTKGKVIITRNNTLEINRSTFLLPVHETELQTYRLNETGHPINTYSPLDSEIYSTHKPKQEIKKQ